MRKYNFLDSNTYYVDFMDIYFAQEPLYSSPKVGGLLKNCSPKGLFVSSSMPDL
jgi:hypothetical protein